MCGCTYIGDTQRSKVVSLAILGSSHPLASRSSTVATQSRRNVGTLLNGTTGTRRRGLVAHTGSNIRGAVLSDRRHGVLVGTSGREMFAVANTALDLLVLQLVLHRLRVGVLALVLGILAPVDAGSEDDVLAD